MKTFVSISLQCSQALVVLFQMQQGSSSQCDKHVESIFNEELAENRTIPQKFYTLSSEDIHILRFLVIFGVFLSLSATFSNLLIFTVLQKISYCHSPSEILLRSLGLTDLFVGIIVVPLHVTNRNLCYHTVTVRSNVIVTACYLPGIVGYSPVTIKGFTQSHFAFSLDAPLCPGKIRARNINKLERIQQRATKVILKNNADYGTRIELVILTGQTLLDNSQLFSFRSVKPCEVKDRLKKLKLWTRLWAGT